jgi:hypothetical protein
MSHDATSTITNELKEAVETQYDSNKRATVAIALASFFLFIVLAVRGEAAVNDITRFFCSTSSLIAPIPNCNVESARILRYVVEALMQISEFGLVVLVSHLIYERTIKAEELEIYDDRLSKISSQFEDRLNRAGESINDRITSSVSNIRSDVLSDFKLSGYGLVQIHAGFDIDTISQLIKKLEPGSTLYWHTTFITDFKKMIRVDNIILKKMREGVHFKFLILEAFCSNAAWRAKETLHIEAAKITNGFTAERVSEYNKDLRAFQQALQSLIKSAALDEHCSGSIEYKLYRSLPSIPFILIEKRSGDIDKCYTGFFLNAPSLDDLLYLEWEGPKILDSSGPIIPMEIKRYWNTKWDFLSRNLVDINPFKGHWWYLVYDLNDTNQEKAIYGGEVDIVEDSENGSLSITGYRYFKRSEEGKSGQTNIHWNSDEFKVNIEDDGKCILTIWYHLDLADCMPGQPKADMKLTYSPVDKLMTGNLNIWGELPIWPHPEVPMRSGSIKFVRSRQVYEQAINSYGQF